MTPLEKAINTFNYLATPKYATSIDPRIRLVVCLVFIGVVLSVSIQDPGRLVWMFVFPILASEISGVGYARVFVKSLWVLPLIVLIAIFNPFIDREPCWMIGSVVVSRGWVSFISVILRGLLTMQALLALIYSIGFYDICRSLNSLGCPKILSTQLLMLYRYIGVMLQEAQTMHRAREARGFGRKSYPLKMWGVFIGQLLIRSIHRSRNINAAMEARGFDGTFRWNGRLSAPSLNSWAWLACWLCIFAALRFVDLTSIFNNLIEKNI